MKSLISSLIGFVLSVSVSAAPLIEGRVRLDSGEPVANAQVRIFDMTDLQRGAIARATTDAAGYFALSLSALGGSALPQAWTLGQNYPNPFNPSTIIPYQVPTAAPVRLEVFNVLGQRIATLVDEERLAGVHTAAWDATDAAGRAVGAGVYFYRLSSAGQPTLTRRMVLLDGQAGQAASSVPRPMGLSSAPAAEGVYGLSVTGTGLGTYVDAAFGVWAGMAPVEVVVEAVEGLPRGKALTDRVLGDVNGDGQVNLSDALLVVTYVVDGSILLLPPGDISLGDVNGDGQVDLADALLMVTYVANPADASLPAGIGQASSGGAWVAGAIRRLTTDGESWYPTWSPYGQQIAFVSGDYIYLMGSDGSNPRRLADDHSDFRDRDFYPTWSPYGRYIAFMSDHDGDYDIYVIDADGSNRRKLTDRGVSFDYRFSTPSWSPDGRHIAFDYYSRFDGYYQIWVMGSDGSNPRNLIKGHGVYPTWSPDGQYIAFASTRAGYDNDIYVMGSDGSNLRRLTDHSAEDGSPTWSPDGRYLAFSSDRDGNREIYVMGSDGSNLRRLTDHWATDDFPTWSPDGRYLAFSSDRDGGSDIYVMELEGGYVMELEGGGETSSDHDDSPATATPLAVGESIEGELSVGDSDFFRVTVSGSVILVASTTGSTTNTYGSIADSSGNVLAENDDGGEDRNFRVSAAVEPGTYYIRVRAFDSWSTGAYTLTIQIEEGKVWTAGAIRRLTEGRSLSWSPDGRQIAFVSWIDGDYRISVMESDGSNPRRLTTDGESWSPTWSPDGRQIAFVSWIDGYSFEISVMDADGSNLRHLADTNMGGSVGSDLSLAWSPDGRHLAFVAYRDGNYEISVMESDGSNRRRLIDLEGHFAEYLTWSPDGRHLAFWSYNEFFVVESDGSNRRSISGGSLTWSPDGRQIAFAENGGISVMESDGSNRRSITDNGWAPTWSPDGRYLAFTSDRDGNREIYVMGSDGSNRRRLIDLSVEYLTWSPDGRHLAFVDVDRIDGRRYIYVMELR